MTEKQAQSACDHEASSIKTTEENAIKNQIPSGLGISTQVSTTCDLE
jgi:hypothetical protein